MNLKQAAVLTRMSIGWASTLISATKHLGVMMTKLADAREAEIVRELEGSAGEIEGVARQIRAVADQMRAEAREVAAES